MRHAQVVIAVFGGGRLIEAPPADMLAICEVRTVLRAVDPAWFDTWRSGSLRAIAERDLPSLTALDAADHVHMIIADVTAPADLSYLEAAWALARYFLELGAQVVLDAHAMRFTREAPPAEAALDVRREVRIVYETSKARPDAGHAIHTRGMRKFGVPDLIALCSDSDVALVSKVIETISDRVARGEDLAPGRHGFEVAPGVIWFLVEDEHGLAHLLHLNNTARVLVDGAGHDLIGIANRRT